MKKTISVEPRFMHASGVRSWLSLQKSVVVQGDIFKLGFKITNTDRNPVKNITIKNIKVRAATDGSGMLHEFKKEYVIGLLNPGDYKNIWISNFGTDMYGLAIVEFNIVSENPEIQQIEAYQINRFSSEEEKHFENKWLDFFYVKSSHEHEQEITNFMLLVFTAVAVILAYLQYFQISL